MSRPAMTRPMLSVNAVLSAETLLECRPRLLKFHHRYKNQYITRTNLYTKHN